MDTLIALDKEFFLFLNALHSPFMDNVMWIISHKFTWIPLYLVIIFFFYYKKNWKLGLVTTVFLILLVIVADKISVVGFKDVFCRLRPSREPSIKTMVHVINGYRGGMYGFVSSHAANSFAIATFTLLYFKRPIISIAMLTWAFVVSYSRIYLGVHYPGDILGGMVLGVACGMLFFAISNSIATKYLSNKLQ